MKYYLYVLKSEVKETYYVGISDDPATRCYYHNNSSKGYTLRYRPWKIVYTHEFERKQEALIAEKRVKSWKSKKMVYLLIIGKIKIDDYLK